MGWLLMLAIVVIYLVLGILYESFIHPFTILSGLPSAGLARWQPCGSLVWSLICTALWALLCCWAWSKNAIMMLDFALEAQKAQSCP